MTDAARFEDILNRLPHGVLVVDRDLVVEYVNPEALRLLGDENGLEIGKPFGLHADGLTFRPLAESLFTADPDVGGHLVVSGRKTLCIQGFPAMNAGRAILTVEDVTDRERLRRAERHFVENAAHELRTPLAAIISVIEALESGAKDTPAVRDRFLLHLLAHSDRLRRLATSLLMLARIQTGQQAPNIELLRVQPLLRQVADDLDASPGVEVSVRASAEIATLADRDLLHRTLSNIAENAAKYTSEGEIAFEARANGDKVELDIRDTGSGMSRTDLEHALDRFYRARGRGRDGFGLGLAIAEEAVLAQGGTLTLDSTLGVGTRARIELPSARLMS